MIYGEVYYSDALSAMQCDPPKLHAQRSAMQDTKTHIDAHRRERERGRDRERERRREFNRLKEIEIM